MLAWIIAIGGMAAVGMIVWRLLQWQESRDTNRDDDSPRH